jgi:ABC-type transport system substrate-binding protein
MMVEEMTKFLILLLGFGSWNPAFAVGNVSEKAGNVFLTFPAAKKGGRLTLWNGANFATLNPLLNNDFFTRRYLPLLFAYLAVIDNSTGDYIPLLAEKIEISADHKVSTFTLREGATWSDGTSITVDDAQFTFDRLMDEKVDAAPVRAFFPGYTFQRLSDRKFSITAPIANITVLPEILDNFAIIQKKQYDGESNFNKAKAIIQPVSSGPYQFKSYSRDQKLELSLKKDWWGFKIKKLKNLYNPEEIVIRIIPDMALAYETWLKGEIDVFEMDNELFGTRVLGSDRARIGTAPGSKQGIWAKDFKTKGPGAFTFIAWNMANPVLSSRATRRALAQLINYKQINDTIYHGLYDRSFGPFGTQTANTDPSLRKAGGHFDYDVKKGLAALRADGWTDSDGDGVLDRMIGGKKVRFEFTLKFNSTNMMRSKISQLVKEDFKRAGIQLNVQSVEWTSLIKQLDEKSFDAVVMGWAGGGIIPQAHQLWATSSIKNGGSNWCSYSNAKVDALIEEAKTIFDMKKREKVFQKMSRLIYDDQPYAFLTERVGFYGGIGKRVHAPSWALKYDDFSPIYLYSME